MSSANPLTLNNNDEAEAPAPASEPSRPTEPWRRPAPLNDSLDALEPGTEDDFDFHDTIPAPPWLDDAPDTIETPLVPAR